MINKALLMEHLKRFWAIPVLAFLVYLLGVYWPMISANNAWRMRDMMLDILTMQNILVLLVVLVTPIVSAYCTFGSFFNKRAVTAFYSFPINKNQLFLTNALAGIILSLLPVLVLCLMLLIPIRTPEPVSHMETHVSHTGMHTGMHLANPQLEFSGGFARDADNPEIVLSARVNTFPAVAGFFIGLAIITLFYFALAWLAYSLAGTGIIGVLVMGFIAVLPFMIFGFIEMVGQFFVFGYTPFIQNNTAEWFLTGLHPITWGQARRWNQGITQDDIILSGIIYIFFSMAMLAGAYVLSRLRKPELTGNSIVFKPVKNFLVFTLSIMAGLIVGGIMYAGSESNIVLHVGMLVGFVIGYFLCQMIAEKTLQVGGKIKSLPIFCGVVVSLYLTMIVFTQFGMGFYVNRVPSADETRGVFFGPLWSVNRMGAEELELTFVQSPEIIAATQAVHRAILDNRAYLHSIPHLDQNTYTRFDEHGELTESRTHFRIHYLLNNGSVVSREYLLPASISQHEMVLSLMNSEEVILSQHVLIRHQELLQSMDISFNIQTFVEEADGAVTETRRNQERAVVYNPAQRHEIAEILRSVVIQRARDEPQSRDWMEAERVERSILAGEMIYISGISANVRFTLDRDAAPAGLSSWQGVHVTGDYAMRLFELVNSWGLLGEEEDYDVFW